MIKKFMMICIVSLAFIFAPMDNIMAQVDVDRESRGNYMASIGKATLLGAGTGIVLGSAYALVTSDNNWGESLKWGFAAGAGGGFVVGVIYVVTRPRPDQNAMINMDGTTLDTVQFPKVDLLMDKSGISGFKMKLLQVDL